MASKKQVFNSFWILVKDRLPKENDEPILLWIPGSSKFLLSYGRIFSAQQYQIRNKTISEKALKQPGMELTGYYATKWMKLFQPEEEK